MNELLDAMERFKTELGATLFRVQSERSVDVSSIQPIEMLAADVAALAKSHPMLPKSMLNEFRTAIRILRNEAAAIPRPATLIQLADALDVVFDLILMGETPQDRVPGRPRII